jgi:hypothetical protein
MADLVTAQIMTMGGPLAHKLERLRDAADHSMAGSPAHQTYAAFHKRFQDGDADERTRMRLEAEAVEAAAEKRASK